jgi:hypothetical protein
MNDGLVLAARIVGVAVAFPLLSWAFGAAVLRRFTRLDAEERFAGSFGVGFAAQALCAFAAFVLHAPQPLFNLAAAAVMLGAALLCRLAAPPRPAGERFPWPMAAVFALGYLHLVCVQALLPAYRGSYWYFDWWMHYDEALLFLGGEPVNTVWANGYTVASRTPLFNLTAAFVMAAAGPGFETYQLASALPSICFPLAVFVLLRDLCGRRAAWLALLLAPLNLWLLHNAWFTWPKMLVAYYATLGLHFYLQSLRCRRADPGRAAGYFFCSGASLLLGFMTHQSVLVYALPLALHAAVTALRERALRPRPRELLAGALLAAAVAGPWYAWLYGTLGGDKITGSTPVTLGDSSARFNPLAVASWMGFNLGVSVVPIGFGEGFVREIPDGEGPPAGCLGEVSYAGGRWCVHWRPDPVGLHRGLMQLYFSLFTGAVTVSLSVFLIVVGARRLWRRIFRRADEPPAKPAAGGPPVWSAVWLFVIGGTLGAAFLHPGKISWGIAHSAAFVSTVVLTALAWGVLARAGRGAALLVCAGMVLEFVLMFWSYWWLLFHDPELLEPGAGAEGPRTATVRMLNEHLAGADVIFLAGALVVQVVLVVLLFRHIAREPAA